MHPVLACGQTLLIPADLCADNDNPADRYPLFFRVLVFASPGASVQPVAVCDVNRRRPDQAVAQIGRQYDSGKAKGRPLRWESANDSLMTRRQIATSTRRLFSAQRELDRHSVLPLDNASSGPSFKHGSSPKQGDAQDDQLDVGQQFIALCLSDIFPVEPVPNPDVKAVQKVQRSAVFSHFHPLQLNDRLQLRDEARLGAVGQSQRLDLADLSFRLLKLILDRPLG